MFHASVVKKSVTLSMLPSMEIMKSKLLGQPTTDMNGKSMYKPQVTVIVKVSSDNHGEQWAMG